MNGLLLDTHALIWFVNGNEKLSKTIRKKINNAILDNEIHIAAISLWEISMLEAKKRITLEMPCLEWINQACHYTHANIVPLTPAIAVESSSLPGEFHEDPADRMIMATARVHRLIVMTRDARILKYGNDKLISTIKI